MTSFSQLFIQTDWLPRKDETLILPLKQQELYQMLRQATKPAHEAPRKDDPVRYRFQGQLQLNQFILSRTLGHPDNYLPRIIGQVEGTSRGVIVFLRYRLFGSTLLFLYLSSLMLFFLTLIFTLLFPHTLYALSALAAGLGNYWITLTNFQRQVERSHEVLLDVLEEAET